MGVRLGRGGSGSSPGSSSRAAALPRRQASRVFLPALFLGLHCPLSRDSRIAPPVPLSSPHRACSSWAARAAPPATPYRQLIARANKAEIPGAGSPAGIKALSEARSNRRDSDVRCPRFLRHRRHSPCPGWDIQGVSLLWAKQK